MLYSNKVKIYREDKMQNESNDNNDVLVKRSVIFILCMVGLLFMSLCVKSGYAVGEAFGELLYNLKH